MIDFHDAILEIKHSDLPAQTKHRIAADSMPQAEAAVGQLSKADDSNADEMSCDCGANGEHASELSSANQFSTPEVQKKSSSTDTDLDMFVQQFKDHAATLYEGGYGLRAAYPSLSQHEMYKLIAWCMARMSACVFGELKKGMVHYRESHDKNFPADLVYANNFKSTLVNGIQNMTWGPKGTFVVLSVVTSFANHRFQIQLGALMLVRFCQPKIVGFYLTVSGLDRAASFIELFSGP